MVTLSISKIHDLKKIVGKNITVIMLSLLNRHTTNDWSKNKWKYQQKRLHLKNLNRFGRVLPPKEIARRKAARAEFGDRCRAVFEKLRPQLREQYYNWFIAVDPDCDEYLIDPSLEGLVGKIRARYQEGLVKLTTYRLNETAK